MIYTFPDYDRLCASQRNLVRVSAALLRISGRHRDLLTARQSLTVCHAEVEPVVVLNRELAAVAETSTKRDRTWLFVFDRSLKTISERLGDLHRVGLDVVVAAEAYKNAAAPVAPCLTGRSTASQTP